jgi:6-phosphogluconolactonase
MTSDGAPEAYDLNDDAPPSVSLPGLVSVQNTKEQVIDVLAADLLVHAQNCVRTFGDFHLALSGGSTPFPLYERLMYDPNLRSFPWTRTHLWMVDERCVPFEHEKSNFRQIKDIIVDHSGIPPEQVHPMLAMLPDAAERYESDLREHLGWRERGQDRLDFVLLGMGDDGHTASLFPGHEAIDERDRLVVRCVGPRVTPPDRVTMTYALLNAARFIAFMICGKAKQAPLRRIIAGSESVRALPASGIRPLAGELKWFLDADAVPPDA